MRSKPGNHRRGPDHPRWSEARMISEEGYVKIRVGQKHPLADPNGYAYEHLVVWVSAGNPRPTGGQLLHHKNEHRTDNRYDNLELLPGHREHAATHGRLRLNEQAVVDIRERYATGAATQAELANEYQVAHQRISKIVRGAVWKKAGGPVSNSDNRVRDQATGRIIGKSRAGRLLDGREHSEFPA